MGDEAFFFPLNLYLIGFMGSGKTTAALCFRDEYSMRILDLDEEIALSEKKSISDIFDAYGEAHFRELESAMLEKAAGERGIAVSCGGGAVLRTGNVALMKKTGLVVYLKVSPRTVCERLKGGGRPLLDGRLDEACVERLMEERREIYEKAADITLSVDGRSTGDICKEIIIRVKRRLKGDV